MTTTRTGHTATRLPGGKVLVTGGFGIEGDRTAAELYGPTTGSFTATGDLVTGRSGHTATLLASGKVLIAGGSAVTSFLASAELYDPVSGNFASTGDLMLGRAGHTATLLPGGQVLLAGGRVSILMGASWTASAELFDPGTAAFTATGILGTTRYGHTATLLPGGQVLISGGILDASPYELKNSERYDPTPGMFAPAADMAAPRQGHTATLLLDGTVLLAGGNPEEAELYDPGGDAFSPAGKNSVGFGTAKLLSSGEVLLVGNRRNGGPVVAELFKPSP